MEPWQYIVLLGAVAAVGAFALPGRNARPLPHSADQTVRNMETALEQFMENMEADNRELAQLVSKTHKEAQQAAAQKEARIAELEKRCAELESIAKRLTDAPPAAAAAKAEASAADHRFPESGQQAAGEAAIGRDTADVLPAEAAASARPEPADEPEDPSATIRGRYAQLFELYDAGKSVETVARKLGMPKGEVQLILQLSKREEETSDD